MNNTETVIRYAADTARGLPVDADTLADVPDIARRMISRDLDPAIAALAEAEARLAHARTTKDSGWLFACESSRDRLHRVALGRLELVLELV